MMNLNNLLNLEWNDYLREIGNFLAETNGLEEYLDVTLVAEDGDTVRSSKFILSACSDFFKRALMGIRGSNTIFFLKGVKHTALKHIVTFISKREIKIEENCLNDFLVACEDLKIKGMTKNNDISHVDTFNPSRRILPKKEKEKHNQMIENGN